MNPFCYKHKPAVMMLLKERDFKIEQDLDDRVWDSDFFGSIFGRTLGKEEGPIRRGRRKVWECPKCGVRYRVGGQVIPKGKSK